MQRVVEGLEPMEVRDSASSSVYTRPSSQTCLLIVQSDSGNTVMRVAMNELMATSPGLRDSIQIAPRPFTLHNKLPRAIILRTSCSTFLRIANPDTSMITVLLTRQRLSMGSWAVCMSWFTALHRLHALIWTLVQLQHPLTKAVFRAWFESPSLRQPLKEDDPHAHDQRLLPHECRESVSPCCFQFVPAPFLLVVGYQWTTAQVIGQGQAGKLEARGNHASIKFKQRVDTISKTHNKARDCKNV